ncbi:hypothetical protein KBD09_03565 [Candidatus Woesebacteria bacterium]|nr:hypothetical protein [Candidatus Woesebacteria bacterium]
MKKVVFVLSLLFCVGGTPVQANEVVSFSSDSTWKSSKIVTAGWVNPDYDDSAWVFAKSPSIGTCTLGKQKPAFTTPMWHPKPVERQTAYFRKSFDVGGKPQKAKMVFAFDDDGEVYINQKKVFVDSSGKTESKEITMDILEHIGEGKNLVALKVTDPRGGCQWVQVYVEIQVEPSESQQTPLFLQTDTQWKDDIYAGGSQDKLDCGATIGQCGCVLTSLAMLLRGYGISKGPEGVNVDPKNLNQYFLKDQKCTGGGCISLGYVFGAVRWSAVHGYSAQANILYKTPKIQYFGKNTFEKTALQSKMTNEKRPIIGKDPKRSHWFVLAEQKDDDFIVLDPIYGKTTLNTKYEAVAEQLVNFQEVNSDFSAIEIYAKKGIPVTMWDTDGKELELTKLYEGFPASTASADLQHFIIPHPQKGIYSIEAERSGFAIYISDQSAQEKFHIATTSASSVTYDPQNISASEITDIKQKPMFLACIGKPLPLRFPIVFTIKADKDYTYKGELVAHELLQSFSSQ